MLLVNSNITLNNNIINKLLEIIKVHLIYEMHHELYLGSCP